jgi:hypothetical protein
MAVRAAFRDEANTKTQLMLEVGLSDKEAEIYLGALKEGRVPLAKRSDAIDILLSKGMMILSGNNREFIPVHPRLAVANTYRTWRERMLREINDRRMRADRLILELSPAYEAATEKRLAKRGKVAEH